MDVPEVLILPETEKAMKKLQEKEEKQRIREAKKAAKEELQKTREEKANNCSLKLRKYKKKKCIYDA